MSAILEAKAPSILTELPGPNARAILAKDAQFVSPSYTRDYPLVVQRGSGPMLEDADGNVFLDFNAGVAVCATGHAHPAIVEAITSQAREFIHISGTDYFYRLLAAMAEKLCAVTPGSHEKRVHLGNSGAEAIETALKVALYHTRRSKFIAFHGAFHGRTLGALSLTASKAAQRRGFGRQLLDVTHVPYANPYLRPEGMPAENYGVECARVIEKQLFRTTVPAEEVAAIVVEPVQGEGGYVVPPKSFLQELRRIATENGIVLIADEVQCGMGRTGKLWASEHFDFVPDILCSAKALGAGLPLSATVARADMMNWHTGAHASTFGGNPVACAAGLKVFDLLENGLIENAAKVGRYLVDGLERIRQRHPAIAEVRGLGLMIGIEIGKPDDPRQPNPELRNEIVRQCFQRGLVVLGAGSSAVRFSPPLVIDEGHADAALEIFEQSLSAARG